MTRPCERGSKPPSLPPPPFLQCFTSHVTMDGLARRESPVDESTPDYGRERMIEGSRCTTNMCCRARATALSEGECCSQGVRRWK